MTIITMPAMLAVLGSVVGSFLATLVIRWPADRSVVRGRSQCDHCGTALAARDLVPLFSAALARGRCRHCGGSIDARHWQIELGAAAIGLVAAVAVPGPVALAGAVFGWLLLALATLDVSEFWLPDRLTGTLALGGLVTGLIGIYPPLTDRLIGGGAGFAGLWLVGQGYQLLRHREGLGGGDPKLLGAIGLWVGWQMLPVILLLASLTGFALIFVRAVGVRTARMDDRVPLGALLAIAAYPAWLFLLGSAA